MPHFQDPELAAVTATAPQPRFAMPERTQLQPPETFYERLCMGQHALRLAGGRASSQDAMLAAAAGSAPDSAATVRCAPSCWPAHTAQSRALKQLLQAPLATFALVAYCSSAWRQLDVPVASSIECRFHDGAQRPTTLMDRTAAAAAVAAIAEMKKGDWGVKALQDYFA